MKKKIAVLLVAAVMGTAAFAQGALSAGVYVLPNFGWNTDADLKGSMAGFGFGAYFDAKYAVVDIGLNFQDTYFDGNKNPFMPNTYLTLGLLGKFPIAIGDKFTIAPAVGIEYQIFLGNDLLDRKDYEDIAKALGGEASDVAKERDNFLIKFGALADFNIVSGLYARAGVLLAIVLPHKDSDPADTMFGLQIPIAIGWKF